MAITKLYGWFDSAEQTEPVYEPPHDAPCLYCQKAITPSDVRTISIMGASPVAGHRSYFYRVHRTCANRHGAKRAQEIDDLVWSMIAAHEGIEALP